jgi:putative transposase
MVNALKGVSSRRYGQAGHPKPYGRDALWSPSYFASSVGGAPLEVLKRYIQNQEKPS